MADTSQEFALIRAHNGWSACPGCGVTVERLAGCEHMLCRCGRQFNYSEHRAAHPGSTAIVHVSPSAAGAEAKSKARFFPLVPASFEVFIKGITGKTSTFPGMSSTYTVARLMQEVNLKQGVAPDEQRLLYGGKQLESHRTLGDYGISRHATIHLVLRLRGGV